MAKASSPPPVSRSRRQFLTLGTGLFVAGAAACCWGVNNPEEVQDWIYGVGPGGRELQWVDPAIIDPVDPAWHNLGRDGDAFPRIRRTWDVVGRLLVEKTRYDKEAQDIRRGAGACCVQQAIAVKTHGGANVGIALQGDPDAFYCVETGDYGGQQPVQEYLVTPRLDRSTVEATLGHYIPSKEAFVATQCHSLPSVPLNELTNLHPNAVWL